MSEFRPRQLEAIASWGLSEHAPSAQIVADGLQRAALASWRRRGEQLTSVQIYSDGSWRTTGAITRDQEAYCMDLLRQITRLLPGLRLRIAGGDA